VIYPGNSWTDCSGTCYDTKTQDCCNGIVFNGTKWEMCAGTCYSSRNQTCCNNSTLINATATCR
jgi:hypothetical protein